MRTQQVHGHRPRPEIARALLDQIRTYREDQGISQSVAGARVGMERSNWTRVERGATTAPGVDRVALMASAVGLKLVLVPVDDVGLDVSELRALGRLCRWFATMRRDKVMPAELASAIRKLLPYAMREDVPR